MKVGGISLAIGLACALLTGPATAGTTAWPPPIESLRDGEACAEPPPCDVDAPLIGPLAAYAEPGRFVRVLNTTASDCPATVGLTDPRARLGNVAIEPLRIELRGDCVVNRRGDVIGAVRDNVIAMCQVSPQPFGAVTLETAIIELAPSGEGRASVPVLGLPWLLVGRESCKLALDVRIEERNSVAAEPEAGRVEPKQANQVRAEPAR